jgi:tetratricopeptide (TPR) repeat protein
VEAPTAKAIIDRAGALLASDPAGAELEARQALRQAPSNPNATLILGSALRRQGRSAEAIAVLEPLVSAFPRADLSRYELGMALADAGQAEAAIDALRTATGLNPGNPETWRALGALLFDQGDTRGADLAFAGHHRALVRDPALQPAVDALYGGRPADAEGILRRIVEASPDDLMARTLLGEALSRLGRHADAAYALRRVLALAPDNHLVRFRLARELYQEQNYREAAEHLEALLEAEPANPSYRNLLAGALAQGLDFGRAVELYEAVLASHPKHATTWVNYGHVLRVVGRTPEAVGAYRRAIALDARLAEPYLGLANLKNASLTAADVEAVRELGGRADLSPTERQRLDLALGQALEDAGDYAGAFAAYAASADARRAETRYDPDAFTRRVREIAQLMTSGFFAARTGFGAQAPDPIFVVGLPRSGSSLVEQILASHSGVEGVGELAELANVARRVGFFPEGVANLKAERAATLGEAYLDASRDWRRLGRPFFVDKMPNNFEFAGLIQLILPNAKIIDVRRHPMATCFSAFKQYFAQGQAFSNRLSDLGRFYRDYVRLMAHFDQALPGRVHRVIYEDLVADPEAEIRGLLGYCGLEFEAACLAFDQTQRPVRTPSSEQVRRPIFREGLEQWRNFEPWLGPLEEALGSALETWRA